MNVFLLIFSCRQFHFMCNAFRKKLIIRVLHNKVCFFQQLSMGHFFAVQTNFPSSRCHKSAQHFRKCCFPGTVRTDNSNNPTFFAPCKVKIQIMDNFLLSVVNTEVLTRQLVCIRPRRSFPCREKHILYAA